MALQKLVGYMQPIVARIARSNLPTKTDLDDLVQVILVKVLSHLNQYSAQAPFHHWISRIAVNTCINALRYERRRPELRHADLSEEQVEVLDLLGSSAKSQEIAHHAAARELTQLLLDSLKPEDRVIMSLAFLEGYSLAEVGDIMKMGEGAVKMRIARAKTKMKATYDRLQQSEKTLRIS